ncbi:AT-hook motif nuclear-localized protein 1-like [Canna indica]|uniref:AT-hook motif nuclear-localized protein n=1 Tax=Canna indica TaxID=4628 RepID=A0AAQ3Q6B5_9LILI|nr:AT-hook motif nuclear-localized protein 1-like [Canna indica]
MEASEEMIPSTPPVQGSESYQPPPPPPVAPAGPAVSEEKTDDAPVGDTPTAAAMTVAAAPTASPAAVAIGQGSPAVASASAPEGSGVVDTTKKKRGRPRKYGPDGRLLQPLNPIPISASVPGGVEYTPASAVGAAMKRGRGRPLGLVSKSPRYGLELESLGEMVASGANFTPHVITVASGEDVTTKIISFSQQGPRAICILSANGVISNVTLRQPDSCGGTLTYEGRFELLSLSGSFMPTENGGTKSRSGGLSVALAGPDGRVVGGGVAGQLVAASPVQVVVGSFLPSYEMEQKVKKQKIDTGSPLASTPAPAISVSSSDMEDTSPRIQAQHNSAIGKSNLSTAYSFKGENWSASLQSVPGTETSTDINISLSGT